MSLKSLIGLTLLTLLGLSIYCLSFLDDLKFPHYVEGCRILGLKGETLFYFNAGRCIFLDHGHFIANGKDLKYFDSDMNIVWRLPIYGHHQMKLIDSKIYLLAHDFVREDNKHLRYDSIYSISLEGKILGKFNYSKEYLHILNKDSVNYRKVEHIPPNLDMSHVNSISKIPKNKNPMNLEPFKEGNILVNDPRIDRLTILTPDLKRILLSIPTQQEVLHDVKVMPSGELLAYSNSNDDGNTEIIYLNQDGKKTDVVIKGSESFLFKTPGWGGVQKLPSGKYLFSNCRPTGPSFHIYNPYLKTITDLFKGIDLESSCVQEIVRGNFSKFLNNHKGF